MTGQLNTTVNGNPASCHAVADWLRTFADNADAAADRNLDAVETATAGWEGPASEAFWYAAYDPRLVCHDLAYTCGEYETALRDFADGLTAAMNRMRDALDHATASCLEIQGPFILPPELTGLEGVESTLSERRAAYSAYNAMVPLFNQCGEIVADARRIEYEAHAGLLATLTPAGRDQPLTPVASRLGNWDDGNTTITAALAYLDSTDKGLANSLRDASRFMTEGQTFQQFALGRLTEMGPADRARLLHAAKDLRNAADEFYAAERYQTRANQFARLIDAVPGNVQEILRKFPWAASLYDPALNAIGAFRGEQTWAQAAAKTTAGGISTAAWLRLTSKARFLPPTATVVVAVGGAIGIELGVGKVVDSLLPGKDDPDPFAQPEAEELPIPTDTSVGGFRTGTYH